jgi:hypothetical protein
MQEQLAEKFAHLLAECAATGNTAELQKEAAAHELVKEAASPLSLGLASLGGAGLGGLLGYYGTDSSKEKNRRRNALYGALSGAIAAPAARVAVPHLLELLQGKSAPVPSVEPKPETPPVKGLAGVGKTVADTATNSVTNNAALTGAGAGALVGARSGAKNPGALSGAAARRGELSRLAATAGGKESPRYLQELAKLPHTPLPSRPSVADVTAAEILKNDVLGVPLAPAKQTLKTRIFGQQINPLYRYNHANTLAQQINTKLPANSQITGPTLLAALEKLPKNQRNGAIGALRGGARGGGIGLLGGMGFEALMRVLSNSVTDPKNAPVK